MFFIILITIATGLISGTIISEEQDVESPSEICNTLMQSKMYPSDFGYDYDGHLMSMSDLVAVSLFSDDGKAADYMSENLDSIYPWPNAYYIKIELENHVQEHNIFYNNYTMYFQCNYITQFDSMITVSIYLYG